MSKQKAAGKYGSVFLGLLLLGACYKEPLTGEGLAEENPAGDEFIVDGLYKENLPIFQQPATLYDEDMGLHHFLVNLTQNEVIFIQQPGQLFARGVEEIQWLANYGQDFRETTTLYDGDIDLHLYSRYAFLVNLTQNEVIFNRNGDVVTYPASLTKMMTVLVGLEQVKDDYMVVQADFARLAQEGAAMANFWPGETRSTMDVLMAVMLPSGADAVETLAIHVAGSEAAFVDLMNEKAQELGMEHTHFVNASGLHHPDHVTTARDMARLLKAGLYNEKWRYIFSVDRYETEQGHPLVLTSRMFDRLESRKVWGGGEILGGKTGYTWEALLSLASFATDGVDEFAFITMNAGGGPFTLQYNVIDAWNAYNYFFRRLAEAG